MGGPVACAGKRRLKLSRSRRFAFSMAMFLLTWLVVEGISWTWIRCVLDQSLTDLRFDQAKAAGLLAASTGQKESIHPYLGWVMNPQSHASLVVNGLTMTVNPLGFCDLDHGIPQRRAGRLVIAVLGGSVAWQVSVAGEDALRRTLQQHPAWNSTEIEIVRLALPGYKQPQQLQALAWLLSMGAGFDAVVNLDGFNELVLPITENFESDVFLAYPRLWNGRMQDVIDPRSDSLSFRVLRARVSRRELGQGMLGSRLRWSPTWNLIWLARDKWLRATLLEYETELMEFHQTLTDSFPGYGPPNDVTSRAALLDTCVALWKNSSRQIQALCRGNRIPYLHLLQPNQYVPDSKPMNAAERAVAIVENQPHISAVREGYPLLLQAGAELCEEGVAFHDLTRLFFDRGEPVYADHFCHFNAHGNELLGQAIAELLLTVLDAAGP